MAQLVVATFGVESDTTALLSSLLYLDLPKVFKDSFPEELFSLLLIVMTYSPINSIFLECTSSTKLKHKCSRDNIIFEKLISLAALF